MTSLVELSDGLAIPNIGLAAFRCNSMEETKQRVRDSLSKGIRVFEIAELFGNGHIIKEALVESGIPRAELFLSLKIWPKKRNPATLLDTTRKAIDIMGFDYFDLILVHAAVDVSTRFDQWKTLEQLKEMELAHTLGVANLGMNDVMVILKNAHSLPTIYEVKFPNRF